MSSDRLPPIPPDQWTQAQRLEAEAVIRGPRGALIEPFVPLLRSPELMGHVQRLGEYLRYRSALALRLSELAILITARQWSQDVEWAIHVPIALREGVAPQTVAAIAERRRPDALPEDEALVLALSRELHESQRVSDATWAHAMAVLGEQAVVDLIALNGYYTLLAMVMNAARTPAPVSDVTPLSPRLPAGAP